MTQPLTEQLAAIVGAPYVSTDADVLDGRSIDHTGRYRGHATALVRPGCTDEVAVVLRACRAAGVNVTVQGGRTSLVAGTVPEHDDVLLSTERLGGIGDVDVVERRIRVGAGVTLAEVQHAATAAGLIFGVDLAARDSATVGGMASTNAGGLRTVCYGNMGEQVIGLDVVLPDGRVVHRHSQVRSDNTGYDLASLFVGAEGTLGVITALDLRLHPAPRHRVTAICGFDDLDALIATGRAFRDMEGIAALELLDARAGALTAEHVGVVPPVRGTWQLLIELAGDTDLTERLAGGCRTPISPTSRRSASTRSPSSGSGRSARRSQRCSASTDHRSNSMSPCHFRRSQLSATRPPHSSPSTRRRRSRCCSVTSARATCT